MAQAMLVLCMLSMFFCYGLSVNICDLCDCQPDGQRVFSITCNCEQTQDLQLTSSMMMNVGGVTMVIIKNCQTVVIERNSFAQLEKLDTLGIQNCQHLYLATGAFSKLNSLLINNVQGVAFGEMAFMGARDVKNIIINSSNITEIPQFALYDVQGLDRLNLYNVNIESIKENAINLNAVSIGIENTKIKNVQKNGFVAEALKVFIKTSEFENLKPSAIKFSTTFQTRLLNNNFKEEFLMEINSPFVEFSGNVFKRLSSYAFKTITLPRLMNNTILDTDFENIFYNFNHKDFHHNLFSCQCNRNLLNFTRNSFNYEILKNNFCNTTCNLSLFEFEVESVATCMKDKFIDVSSLCTSRVELSTLADEGGDDLPIFLQPRFLHDLDELHLRSESNKFQLNLFATLLVLLLLLTCN
ncbi:hypothetical protein RN001_012753 [Aquatica leii]|uniref:Uncharacterized protein n=1 Tax=Aquatica leii TaxID=1421715 RepID=A0AAN7S7X0_9COLE|nr:hypothetical protein RN001_012753 [Aquatica leii]